MPILYNVDHQAQILGAGVAVQPGEGHEFAVDQIARGVAGLWSETDPRRGLDDEKAFKARRDAPVRVRAKRQAVTPDPEPEG